MTLYAGETVRIRCVATDVAGGALTSAEVTLAEVAIFGADGTEVTQKPLVWNAALNYWYYDWLTPQAGTFRIKSIFHGAAFKSWEYVKLRVKAHPLDQSLV